MKLIKKLYLILPAALVALAGLTLLVLAWTAQASVNEAACTGQVSHVTSATSSEEHVVFHDFLAQGGTFDETPLLSTSITVGGAWPSCLTAHLSTMTRSAADGVVFQVRIDGVPMEGHIAGYQGYPAPVVVQEVTADESAEGVEKMVAYNFVGRVTPGPHLVEVVWASCCNRPGDTYAYAHSPVLTLYYK
ncbi:MAG: hypothetical protein AB1791_11695 [Chloroflexota bacterium]